MNEAADDMINDDGTFNVKIELEPFGIDVDNRVFDRMVCWKTVLSGEWPKHHIYAYNTAESKGIQQPSGQMSILILYTSDGRVIGYNGTHKEYEKEFYLWYRCDWSSQAYRWIIFRISKENAYALLDDPYKMLMEDKFGTSLCGGNLLSGMTYIYDASFKGNWRRSGATGSERVPMKYLPVPFVDGSCGTVTLGKALESLRLNPKEESIEERCARFEAELIAERQRTENLKTDKASLKEKVKNLEVNILALELENEKLKEYNSDPDAVEDRMRTVISADYDEQEHRINCANDALHEALDNLSPCRTILDSSADAYIMREKMIEKVREFDRRNNFLISATTFLLDMPVDHSKPETATVWMHFCEYLVNPQKLKSLDKVQSDFVKLMFNEFIRRDEHGIPVKRQDVKK